MSWDPNYGTDREFGDLFIPEVKAIMGSALLTPQYIDEDMERNTDLIVLEMANKRIGMRVRRHKYLDRYDKGLGCDYRDEITIRFTKDSGHITEFEKVVRGFGDYFFYAFADGDSKEDSKHLCRFVIMDYDKIREFVIREIWVKGRDEFLKGRIQKVPNGDTFIVFRIHEIKNGILQDSDNGWELTMGWNQCKEEAI